MYAWCCPLPGMPKPHLLSQMHVSPPSDARCTAFTPALQRVRDALVSERQRLFEQLSAVPYLQPFPSHSNFILCKVAEGRDAKGLKDSLAQEHGIMVRHYSTKELNNYIRISVGLPEQTDRVLAALQALQ